jgi:MoaA/NifB/PqqE/SkfB family radical SAM enzyme
LFCVNKGLKLDLTISEIKERVDRIAESCDFERVVISGGEITINQNIFEIIDYIKSKGLKFAIASNLRRFSDYEFSKKFVSRKPDFIFGSFYSIEKQIHEKITRSSSYEETLEGLKNLIMLKQELTVNIALTKINQDSILDTIKALNSMGINKFCIGLVQPVGSKDEIAEYIPLQKPVKILGEIIELCKKLDINLLLDDFPICWDNQIAEYESSLRSNEITHAFEGFEEKITVKEINNKSHEECIGCKILTPCQGLYKQYLKHLGQDCIKKIK